MLGFASAPAQATLQVIAEVSRVAAPSAEPCEGRLGLRDEPARPAIGLELQLTFYGSAPRKLDRAVGRASALRVARQRAPSPQRAGKARDRQA